MIVVGGVMRYRNGSLLIENCFEVIFGDFIDQVDVMLYKVEVKTNTLCILLSFVMESLFFFT